MNAFIIMNAISLMLLSPTNSTTLTFPDPIEYSVVGDVGDAEVFSSGDRKTITIKPLKEINSYRNMVFKTKKNVFYFKFKTSSNYFTGFLNLKIGKKNLSYTKVKENSLYKVMEGESSLLVINKSSEPVNINGNLVPKSIVLSKGLPVFINDELVY